MNARRLLPAWIALLALAACSRASLELDPALVPACKPGHSEVIEVRWDARDSGAKRIAIDVLRPGTAAKPWISGAPSGSRRTGRWGNDGLTFVLRDQEGRELARRTIESGACPEAQDD